MFWSFIALLKFMSRLYPEEQPMHASSPIYAIQTGLLTTVRGRWHISAHLSGNVQKSWDLVNTPN